MLFRGEYQIIGMRYFWVFCALKKDWKENTCNSLPTPENPSQYRLIFAQNVQGNRLAVESKLNAEHFQPTLRTFAAIYFYQAIIYLVFLFKLGVLKAKEKNFVRFDSLLFTSFSRRKIQEEANKTEDRCQYI